MKPSTIKFIDKYAGISLCFLLTVVKAVSEIFKGKAMNYRPHRILLVKLIEQGATVLAIPSIKRAIEITGDASRVYFCVFKENRPVLDLLDLIPPQNIFEIRSTSILAFIVDVIKFIIFCRKNKIDGVVDMEFFSRASAILCYLSGAKVRAGYHRFTSEYPYRGNLMTKKIQYNPYIHVSIAYYLLVESLIRDEETPMIKIPYSHLKFDLPQLTFTEKEKQEVYEMLLKENRRRILTRPFIILNPNASDLIPLRKWPAHNFIALARRILDEFPQATIILTGAPSEAKPVSKIAEEINHPNVISMAGKTTLKQLLILYEICDLLVTNDSGPAHFSSLTGIKSIIMYGPETPLLFGPITDRAYVIWKKLACSPCVNVFNHRFSPCNDNKCMQAITVEEVFGLISGILNSQSVIKTTKEAQQSNFMYGGGSLSGEKSFLEKGRISLYCIYHHFNLFFTLFDFQRKGLLCRGPGY